MITRMRILVRSMIDNRVLVQFRVICPGPGRQSCVLVQSRRLNVLVKVRRSCDLVQSRYESVGYILVLVRQSSVLVQSQVIVQVRQSAIKLRQINWVWPVQLATFRSTGYNSFKALKGWRVIMTTTEKMRIGFGGYSETGNGHGKNLRIIVHRN